MLMIRCLVVELGYKDSDDFILSKNLVSALMETEIIEKKLVNDFRNSKVEEVADII